MNNYPNGPYPPQQPGQGPYTQYPQPAQPQYPPPGYPQIPPQQPMRPPKKPMSGWLIAGIIIGALALCGGIGSFSKGFKSGMDGTSSADSSSSVSSSTDIGNDATPTPTPTPARTWQTTHTYSGNGNQKTETFTVGNDWKIQWKCNPGDSTYGGVFYVSVDNSDTSMQEWDAVSANCKYGKDTTGETYQHKGGDVYLDVITGIEWAITIQELK